jgi:hypothetical protein
MIILIVSNIKILIMFLNEILECLNCDLLYQYCSIPIFSTYVMKNVEISL